MKNIINVISCDAKHQLVNYSYKYSRSRNSVVQSVLAWPNSMTKTLRLAKKNYKNPKNSYTATEFGTKMHQNLDFSQSSLETF